MEAMTGVLARLDRVEKDIETNNKYRHEMRHEMSAQDKALAVINRGQEEISTDLGDLKEQVKWVLRGLVGAIITFTGLIVTIVVAVFNNG